MNKELTLEIAEHFLINPDSIELSEFATLSDAAAESLRKYNGWLELNVTSLSDAAAESLGKHKGYLSLNGLTSLSDAAAGSLSRHEGRLHLYGLTNLSDTAAESLSRHKGDLILNGLQTLTDAAAESLSMHKDYLYLNGLTSLSNAAAESLSRHENYLVLSGLQTLSDAAAESLSRHKGDLDLNGLQNLTDAAAELLSRHEGYIGLIGITDLSGAAAESLSRHKGKLNLDGLSDLTDAAADSLSRHKGNLNLNGLLDLSDASVESLSRHKGDLSLDGLTSISDASAQSLSRHKGDLSLGLTSLSDKAAEALGKHNDYLELLALKTISDSALESLTKNNEEINLNEFLLDRLNSIKKSSEKGIIKSPTNYFIRFVLQKGSGIFPKISDIRKTFPKLEPLSLIKDNLKFCLNNDNELLPIIDFKIIDDGFDSLQIGEEEYEVGPKPVIWLQLQQNINPKDLHNWYDLLNSSYELSIEGLNDEDPFHFEDHNGYSSINYSEWVSDELWDKLYELAKHDFMPVDLKISENISISKFQNFKNKIIQTENDNVAIEIKINEEKYIWGFEFEKDSKDIVCDNFYIDYHGKEYPEFNHHIWTILDVIKKIYT